MEKGSFNICVPMLVASRFFSGKVMLRCPMPFKVTESTYPGTVDEKMRSEVGAYVWMQHNCSEIRIPKLHGFGLSNYQVQELSGRSAFFPFMHLPVFRSLHMSLDSHSTFFFHVLFGDYGMNAFTPQLSHTIFPFP